MGVNRGKFFDAKLTEEYFDGMRNSVMKYSNGASDAHMSFAMFKNEPTFQGITATATKEFIHGAVGSMLTEITDVKDQMIRNQNYIMESFETMVDPSRNARIEFDTLEKINTDFKGFYRSFTDHANEVENLVNGLNSEFGSYAHFDKPNKSSAMSGFEIICGGDSDGGGHFRMCQNKLVEFDSAMNSFLKGGDVVDRTVSMDTRLNNALAARGSFKPQENVLNDIQVEYVLYDGNEAMAMGAGAMAAFPNLFGLFKKKPLGTDPFDDKGQYGGDQGGSKVVEKDKKLYEFIKQHPGYENYSDEEIQNLLKRLNSTGCTYVAAVNAIFNEYKGREEEFEKTFGFPMVGKDGDLNYDMLLLDYYLETKDKVYFTEIYGQRCFEYSMQHFYMNHPDIYKKEYGEDLYDENGNLTKEFFRHCCEITQKADEDGVVVAVFEDTPCSFHYSVDNRLTHYCKDRGLDVEIMSYGKSMAADDIKEAINEGKTVCISSNQFDLEYEDGTLARKDVGGHEMTITGVTSDGRYIVSTWGKKLYYDPVKNKDHTVVIYTIEIEEKDN